MNFKFCSKPNKYTSIYDKDQKKIFASVNAGDYRLYVGGYNINGEFKRILSEFQNVDEYLDLHVYIKNNYDLGQIVCVNKNDVDDYPYFIKNTYAYKNIFIHEFNDDYCIYNKNNKYMIYIIPPYGKNPKYNTLKMFYDDIYLTSNNMMKLINTINNNNNNNIEIVRVCLFSGKSYLKKNGDKLDVAKSIIMGIYDETKKYEYNPIIEFAYDDDVFKFAYNKLFSL
jgi:hypothetical protein